MHGYCGVKPGWTRLNFHFLMTDEEFDFIFDAICFVCRYGKYFLSLYRFDIHTGIWFNKGYSTRANAFRLETGLFQDNSHPNRLIVVSQRCFVCRSFPV